MKKFDIFYEGSQSLEDDVIYQYVADELSPVAHLLVEIHLAESPDDQARVGRYRDWRERCLKFRDELASRSSDSRSGSEQTAPSFTVIYHDFRADFKAEEIVDCASSKTKIKEPLAADSSLRSNSPKPSCDIREQHMKEVEICGVRLRVTLTRFENDRIWLEIEALETDPVYRVFTFGIGPYTGQAILQGDHPPFFKTEMPSSLFSSFGHVQIKLQPTNE